MTIAGALGITGGIFVVAALVLGTVAGEVYGRTTRRRLSTIGWVAFALAIGFSMAAVWTAVLTLAP